MEFNNYERMLERARSEVPEDIREEKKFEPPKVEIRREAGNTIILNWNKLVKAVNDQEKVFLRFLAHELGTHGETERGKTTFKGSHSARKINRLIEEFVDVYIICSECGRPDTKLQKEKGRLLKKCQACGAWQFVEPP